MAKKKALHFQAGSVVDARPLTAADRKKHGIEDARQDHIGIYHPVSGALLNTMSPDDFKQHYHPAEAVDTAAKPAAGEDDDEPDDTDESDDEKTS